MVLYEIPESLEITSSKYSKRGEQLTLPIFDTSTVEKYLQIHGFALSSELFSQKFNVSDIEKAVNDGGILYFHCPEEMPEIALYSLKNPEILQSLKDISGRISQIQKEERISLSKFQKEEKMSLSELVTQVGSKKDVVAGLIYSSSRRNSKKTTKQEEQEDIKESFYQSSEF